MELRDAIVTPIFFFMILFVALIIQPSVTDSISRKYFMTGLIVRVVGALALGFIYQFYYHGGDTYNYHTIGSRVLWGAIVDSPSIGFNLLFHNTVQGSYQYWSHIYFYNDPAAFAIVQLATVFDLFTFSSYSATALLFSVLGFVGSWLMFLVFYDLYPHLHKRIAFATFFIPSVVFWGSGLLKDTVTFFCIGVIFYTSYYLFIKRNFSVGKMIWLLIAIVVLYRVKIYILLSFVPSMVLWVFFVNLATVKNKIARTVAAPVVIIIALGLSAFAAVKAGEDNPKYAIDQVAKTAQITANDILYGSGVGAGSGYSLGKLDGTFGSMLKLAPQAVVVTLFRPFLWEVRNVLMVISAFEAFGLLSFLIVILMRSNFFAIRAMANPSVIFCLVFSLIFAFAVGVSTYNFGTLVRYKIPILPFFMMALFLIDDLARQLRTERFRK